MSYIFGEVIPVRSGDQPYSRCKWCHGKGCLACQQEMEKDYREEFPEGPQPLASISLDDTDGMKRLASILSPEGLASAQDEAVKKVDSSTGLMGALLKASDEMGSDFRAAVIADETSRVINEKLLTLVSSSPDPQVS